ncbi:hypothetical protein BaRGS_00002566, partial [Batillaria attramentaria]
GCKRTPVTLKANTSSAALTVVLPYARSASVSPYDDHSMRYLKSGPQYLCTVSAASAGAPATTLTSKNALCLLVLKQERVSRGGGLLDSAICQWPGIPAGRQRARFDGFGTCTMLCTLSRDVEHDLLLAHIENRTKHPSTGDLPQNMLRNNAKLRSAGIVSSAQHGDVQPPTSFSTTSCSVLPDKVMLVRNAAVANGRGQG